MSKTNRGSRAKFGWLAGAAALAGVGALALPALAQPGPGRGPGGPGFGGPAMMMGERLFTEADADKDGKVTRAELQAASEARFKAIDGNSDGVIVIEEWQGYWTAEFGRRSNQPESLARRAAMFRMLDIDGNGRITLEEFRQPVEAMFRGLDANSDGMVTREELPSRQAGHHGPRGPGGPGRAPGAPSAAPGAPAPG